MPESAPLQSRLTLQKRIDLLFARALAFRPFGVRESESIMQFAHLGILTCLCDGRHGFERTADRRDVCRGCGGQAVACAAELLDREVSQAEIRALTESLRLAGVRAAGIEIPGSIHSVSELHRFLDDKQGKKGRRPPRRPNAPVKLQRATTR